MNTKWTDERIAAELDKTRLGAFGNIEAEVKAIIRQMRDELTTALFASETACAECLAENARLTAERDQLQALLHSQIATCEALQAELTSLQAKTDNIKSEEIECPSCNKRQQAQIICGKGDPWPILVHKCTQCQYVITESEWNAVKD